jgi:hypothetical protein
MEFPMHWLIIFMFFLIFLVMSVGGANSYREDFVKDGFQRSLVLTLFCA